jgi:hypothetical protein
LVFDWDCMLRSPASPIVADEARCLLDRATGMFACGPLPKN